MNHKEPMTLEDILDEIMLQETAPTHEALVRWCQQYPEHREALSRFFATWAVQENDTKKAPIDEARVASRMVSHALNLLYQKSAPASAEAPVGAEDRLHKMVAAAGCSDETLLAECNLDDSLVAKMDRHLVVFATIPRACIEKLAQVFHRSVSEVTLVLQGNPIPRLSYKAKTKPISQQETFLDAVATSDLSDTAKQEWERIAAAETPDQRGVQ